MVGAEGFEPPTLWSQTRCATRLRYAPTSFSLSHGVDKPFKRFETWCGCLFRRANASGCRRSMLAEA